MHKMRLTHFTNSLFLFFFPHPHLFIFITNMLQHNRHIGQFTESGQLHALFSFFYSFSLFLSVVANDKMRIFTINHLCVALTMTFQPDDNKNNQRQQKSYIQIAYLALLLFCCHQVTKISEIIPLALIPSKNIV